MVHTSFDHYVKSLILIDAPKIPLKEFYLSSRSTHISDERDIFSHFGSWHSRSSNNLQCPGIMKIEIEIPSSWGIEEKYDIFADRQIDASVEQEF